MATYSSRSSPLNHASSTSPHPHPPDKPHVNSCTQPSASTFIVFVIFNVMYPKLGLQGTPVSGLDLDLIGIWEKRSRCWRPVYSRWCYSCSSSRRYLVLLLGDRAVDRLIDGLDDFRAQEILSMDVQASTSLRWPNKTSCPLLFVNNVRRQGFETWDEERTSTSSMDSQI